MQIFIRSLSGKTLIFEVDPDDTVESLKIKIEDKEGIPNKKLSLSSVSSILEDSLKIGKYCLKDGCTLNLGLRSYLPPQN